jgi:hypothetical protein
MVFPTLSSFLVGSDFPATALESDGEALRTKDRLFHRLNWALQRIILNGFKRDSACARGYSVVEVIESLLSTSSSARTWARDQPTLRKVRPRGSVTITVTLQIWQSD